MADWNWLTFVLAFLIALPIDAAIIAYIVWTRRPKKPYRISNITPQATQRVRKNTGATPTRVTKARITTRHRRRR